VDAATLLTTSRRRARLTQRALAELAGTSAAAVCLYERGDRVPRIDTLTRLVAATGANLRLSVTPPPPVDVEANGRTLADLLSLADHLPQRSGPELDAPVFAALAGRAPAP
jgi:transcriptional regulator with XRE-family HTH domain